MAIITNEIDKTISVGKFQVFPHGSVCMSWEEIMRYSDLGWIPETATIRDRGQHYISDTEDYEYTQDAIDESSAHELCTSLGSKMSRHFCNSNCHRVIDPSDMSLSPTSKSSNGLIVMTNDIKSALNFHTNRLCGVHAMVGSVIECEDARTPLYAICLLNLCKHYYNTHICSVAMPLRLANNNPKQEGKDEV